jgi:AcrR family transcriptional regulator
MKKPLLVSRVADALLEMGVAQIPLRDLAARLGTSDRMLLYYFEDKATLVRLSLTAVSDRLIESLGRAFPAERVAPPILLGRAMAFFASAEMMPVMNVWADMAARGSRGEEPFRALAQQSIGYWLGWLDERLDVADAAKRRTVAAAILTIIEGTRMIEGNASGAADGVAALLAGGLGAGTSEHADHLRLDVLSHAWP